MSLGVGRRSARLRHGSVGDSPSREAIEAGEFSPTVCVQWRSLRGTTIVCPPTTWPLPPAPSSIELEINQMAATSKGKRSDSASIEAKGRADGAVKAGHQRD